MNSKKLGDKYLYHVRLKLVDISRKEATGNREPTPRPSPSQEGSN
ncbi:MULTISPECIES: hypothetical protein [unclassified Okeania]|nr:MULTISPECIES: hypothetical protein [unclassified Okeania]